MAKNRALAVLTDLVAQREREVIEEAISFDAMNAEPLLDAVEALEDARALLAKATEPTTQPKATP